MMGLAVRASSRLRHVIFYCLCIYICIHHKNIELYIFHMHASRHIFDNHTCLQLYIYIYTLLFLYIYIHRWIHFIYTRFNIYIYIHMYLYSLDIQRPEKEFSWFFANKNMIRSTGVHLKGCSPGCRGIWSLHPQKSTYCWWFRNPANSPVDMVDIPVYIFTWFHTRQVVHDPTQQRINDIRWLM